MKTTEALVLLINLLEDNWTAQAFARNQFGEPVAADSPEATRWDVVGGLYKVTGCHATVDRIVNEMDAPVRRAGWDQGIIRLNDQLSHRSLLGLLESVVEDLNSGSNSGAPNGQDVSGAHQGAVS